MSNVLLYYKFVWFVQIKKYIKRLPGSNGLATFAYTQRGE